MTSIANLENEIAELLPFYVNETLTDQERAAIDEKLAENPDLRGEIAAITELRATWKAMPVPTEEGSPGEKGLSRLMAEIDADTAITKPSITVPEPANTNAPLYMRFAQLAAAAAFGALMTGLWIQDPAVPDGAEMVSGPTDILADIPTLTVEFREDAGLADISATLRDFGLTIVDGPSAVGLYRLARVDGGALSMTDSTRLRAIDQIFLLVDDPQ